MVFIKKDEIISTDDFIIYKTNKEGLKVYGINIYVIKQNRDYTLAEFNNEKEQENLYINIISAVRNKSYYLNISEY